MDPAKMKSTTKICPYCGHKLLGGVRICNKCGRNWHSGGKISKYFAQLGDKERGIESKEKSDYITSTTNSNTMDEGEIKRNKIDKWHYKNKFKKIVKALEDEDYYSYAAKVLTEIGEPVVELLHTALKKLNDVGRYRAAEILGKMVDSRSVEPLIEALKDNYGPVRSHAAEALGKIGDETAVIYLIELFDNEEEYIVESASKAVGKIGGSNTVHLLLEQIEKRSAGFHGATKALVIIGDRSAVDPLIKCLSDGSYLEKESAAEALGKLGDPRALKPLEELLDVTAPVRDQSGNLIDNPVIKKAVKRLKKLSPS